MTGSKLGDLRLKLSRVGSGHTKDLKNDSWCCPTWHSVRRGCNVTGWGVLSVFLMHDISVAAEPWLHRFIQLQEKKSHRICTQTIWLLIIWLKYSMTLKPKHPFTYSFIKSSSLLMQLLNNAYTVRWNLLCFGFCTPVLRCIQHTATGELIPRFYYTLYKSVRSRAFAVI